MLKSLQPALALAFAVLVLGLARDASGATIFLVDGSGKLIGADGVLVTGTLYDVRFIEGSCIEVFGLCNELSDFTFQTAADAEAASLALLSQVFLDGPDGDFDSDAWMVFGCGTASSFCDVYTPYGLTTTQVQVFAAHNFSLGQGTDFVHGGLFPKGTSTATSSSTADQVFARWTPAATAVPEPASMLLIGVGSAWMLGRRRRRHS